MADGRALMVRFSRRSGLTTKRVLATPMTLPVLIGEFSVEESFDWRNYKTHRAGEFSVPAAGGAGATNLRVSDLETLTIDWYAPFLTQWQDPATFKRAIVGLARAKTPFELTASLTEGDELRMLAKITNLRRTLKPGEPDTRYWSIGIEEYRSNRSNRRAHGMGAGGKELPRKHKLVGDESFEDLARRYYGSYTEWRRIAVANGVDYQKWGGSMRITLHAKFKPGDEVTIPTEPPVVISASESWSHLQQVGGRGA